MKPSISEIIWVWAIVDIVTILVCASIYCIFQFINLLMIGA